MVNFVFLSVYFYSVPNLRFPSFSHDWKIYTFDDIASYKKGPFGSALKKDLFVPKSKESVKVYEQQNAINKDCHLERYFISANYYEKMKSFTVYPGDTIVSCAGTIGELYTLPENADIGIINQALMIIRNNQAIILKDFLNIQFSRMIDEFSKTYSNGSAIKNIPPFSDLKRKKTYVPDKLEQEKIIKFISLLDQKITTQIKIIDDYNSLKIGIYNWMFKENYADYKLKQLAYIVKGDQINNDQLLSNGSYYMMNGGTSPSGYLDSYNVSENTISISEGGNSCGYVQFNSSPFWSGGHCYTIQNVNSALIDNKYLYHYLKHKEKEIMNLRIGTGLPNIQKRDLENFTILAPNLSIQRKNLALFEMLDEKISVLNEELTILKKQKKYLLCNMFI